MKAVRCPVGLDPEEVEVGDFDDLRHFVGEANRPAHVTSFAVGLMWTCWVNEDGLPLGLPFNRTVNGKAIVGTFVMMRTAGKKDKLPFGDMTDEQSSLIIRMVKGWYAG